MTAASNRSRPTDDDVHASADSIRARVSTAIDSMNAVEGQRVKAVVAARLFRAPATDPLKVGRFKVLSKIGQGGMGVVYSAFDESLGRRVAIKVLAGSADVEATERMQHEAQAMARLSHPNVVQVYETGLWRGRVYIVMEYVKGQTLRAWLREADHDPAAVFEVFAQAGRGLAAAHEEGLVHRDFKPDNVMVDDRGRVRVMDFGLARTGDDEELAPSDSTIRAVGIDSTLASPVTRTGAMLGTPAYMSPEQFRGERADTRADQFSFCVALYEALTDTRPFAGESLRALALNVTLGNLRVPPKQRMPTAVRRVVERGLRTQPRERWPSMRALLSALDVARKRGRRRLGVALGGLLGLAGAVAMAAPKSPSTPPVAAPQCRDASELAEDLWDPEDAAELARAFAVTGLPYAADSATRSADALNTYARGWAEARAELCTQHAHGELSEPLFDRRVLCLDERAHQASKLREVLLEPNPDVVRNAVAATAALPSIASCAALPAENDVAALDAHTAAAVTDARRMLLEVRALRDAGQYPTALTKVVALEKTARAVDHAPFTAAVLTELGLLRHHEFQPARAVLDEAWRLALTHGLDDAAIEAGIASVHVMGTEAPQREVADARADTVMALLDRLSPTAQPPADERRARLRIARGMAALHEHEYEGAEVHLRRAHALTMEVYGEQSLAAARALGHLGHLEVARGHFDEAVPQLEAAVERLRASLGPAHPDVALHLNRLGLAYKNSGRFADAERVFEEALAAIVPQLGPHHPTTHMYRGNLANVFWASGEYDRAPAFFEAWLASTPPNAQPSTGILISYVQILFTLDRTERAAEILEEVTETAAGLDAPEPRYRAYQGLAGLYHWRSLHADSPEAMHADVLAATDAGERALLALADTPLDPMAAGEAHELLANLSLRAGDRDAAFRHIDQARTAYQRSRRGEAPAKLARLEVWVARLK